MEFFFFYCRIKSRRASKLLRIFWRSQVGNKTAVCGVERRAKEWRRPHFSSIGASDKTSTGRDAKQHNLLWGGKDAHWVRGATKRRNEQNLDFNNLATAIETRRWGTKSKDERPQWCSCASSHQRRQHSCVSSLRKSNKTNIKRSLPRSTRAASSRPAGNESRRFLPHPGLQNRDWFFFFLTLLFLLLVVQHFVSAAPWSRERGEGTACHSFINNSERQLFLSPCHPGGVCVFFFIVAVSSNSAKRRTVCVFHGWCFSCRRPFTESRQRHLNRFRLCRRNMRAIHWSLKKTKLSAKQPS